MFEKVTGAVSGFVDNLMNGGDGTPNSADRDLAEQSKLATDQVKAGTDGPLGEVIPLYGTDSLFNPFYVFRYSKFATGIEESRYNFNLHKLVYQNSSKLLDSFKSGAQLAAKAKEEMQNPSAIKIIDWANKKAEAKSGPTYPYPYALNDFLWCKWYGKIPNNRLLTLRRYPIPIEDNLQVHNEKLPLVPIAQAVTWFGEGTGNQLGNILNIDYGFNWRSVPAEVQDVQGNEIAVEKLFETLGVTNPTAQQALKVAFSQKGYPMEFSGFDKTLQDFTKENWGANGAYWNRIKGPINVINETKMRERGYTYTHNIKIDFEYNLRSYGNLNPKVALLDLISNMLSLTSNTAPFWGGSYRYYKQTGVLLPGFNSDAMEKGDYEQGAKEVLELVTKMAQGTAGDIKGFLESLNKNIGDANSMAEAANSVVDAALSSKGGQALIASRAAGLHQKPLLMRALLDGRAVGEWHLMVGNPMDPIAVIGNLCLKNTTLTFSEELGADDFPVSVKFTVNLEPGRHRAKQDIASMFNHGGGDFGHTPLSTPSSAMNTFGEYNTTRLAMANPETGDGDYSKAKDFQKDLNVSATAQGLGSETNSAVNLANYFKASVSGRYGEGFGKSPILVDYFTKLKTKD